MKNLVENLIIFFIFLLFIYFQRAANELSSHQKKILMIDEHVGISIAGLLSDARLLARFMQSEGLDWRWAHKEPIPLHHLMGGLAQSKKKLSKKNELNLIFFQF